MKESLRLQIEESFNRVQLDDGIGLFEAQGIDDYETKEKCAEYRKKDEKENWRVLNYKHLDSCHSSLSFFDPKGMRFHLPAYLLQALDGPSEFVDIIFHLTDLNEYKMNQFSALNQPQRISVRNFLEWAEKEKRFEFERSEITEALEAFWSK